MRFLERNNYYSGYFRRKNNRFIGEVVVKFIKIWAIVYILLCIFLYFRQDHLLYRANPLIAISSPGDRNFQLNHQDVWIDVTHSSARIHGWWFPTPDPETPVVAFNSEPANVLASPKTILYLGGRDASKTHYNSLTRIQALQQLGFSVLGIDYRGYGLSEGRMPNESRLYQDSRAAWDYLTYQKQIAPQDIIIYGESLGGAIAIDLAVEQEDAGGLIVQSSFTSMPEQIKKTRPGLKVFPLGLIINQRFNSLAKVRSLEVPVLFLHGTADTIVDYKMSRKLYYAAPEPKNIFYIPGGKHFSLYKPGKHSYLGAIERFVAESIEREATEATMVDY